MNELEANIAVTAKAINRQIEDLASDRKRLTLNVMILEDGRIHEIENHMHLQQKVEDDENILKDMLRHLDELIKERDGIKVSGAVQGET